MGGAGRVLTTKIVGAGRKIEIGIAGALVANTGTPADGELI